MTPLLNALDAILTLIDGQSGLSFIRGNHVIKDNTDSVAVLVNFGEIDLTDRVHPLGAAIRSVSLSVASTCEPLSSKDQTGLADMNLLEAGGIGSVSVTFRMKDLHGSGVHAIARKYEFRNSHIYRMS